VYAMPVPDFKVLFLYNKNTYGDLIV